MNTAMRFLTTKLKVNLKAHGLKAVLPLLLLMTACGEGTPSTQQSDAAPPAALDSVLSAAQPSGGFGVPSVDSDPLDAPEVSLPATDADDISFEDVLPPSEADDADEESAAAAAGVDAAAVAESVPEPAALTGLAIAAVGLVTIKRKQAT